jgi:uncharacterized tellurite resistance protein B-like protein
MTEAVQVLRDALPQNLRVTILHDLAEIARADGEILSEERDFISKIASEWQLKFENDAS